jgi:hypothetical protein
MELFSLRKIHRICPQGCGPCPPASAQGSTDFIKHRLLASGLTAQIEPSEPISWLLLSVVHHRSNGQGGWLRPGAACHSRAQQLARVWVFSSYGGRFFIRFAPMGSQWQGERDMLTLIGGERQRSPATVRRLGRCLAMVRAASGEALAPRMCAKASSSSLLASRPTNCSEQWQKTQIWWLPRVRRVLDLRPKIRTIWGAIYLGF